MQQTLFYVPHFLFNGPILYFWILVCILFGGWLIYKHGLGSEFFGFVPIALIVAAAIYFVLPQLEVLDVDPANPDGELVPAGLAVRGYGFMMLLGILAGMGLAMVRARQIGIDPDKIVSLCFWMIVGGILGARLFFVIQKQEQFSADSFRQLIIDMVDMTKGGLVVYGSLIGALVAFGLFVWRAKISFWKTADIIAPAMAIGLALGRVGCLLNGCCFGGQCDIEALAVNFPAGSPPYLRQLETGDLIGLKTSPGELGRVVDSVKPGSIGERYQIQPGEQILSVLFPEDQWIRAILNDKRSVTSREHSQIRIQTDGRREIVVPADTARQRRDDFRKAHPDATLGGKEILGLDAVVTDESEFPGKRVARVAAGSLAADLGIDVGDWIRWSEDQWNSFSEQRQGGSPPPITVWRAKNVFVPISELPARTGPVHATQVYSAINAALICAFLWFYYPFRRQDGEVIALMFILYPITRFLLEAIRTDEAGQFGTALTISQWVSIGAILLGFCLLAKFRTGPKPAST